MKYDLATMAARQGLKRRETAFAPILTTSAQANDLAAISRRIIAPWLDAKTAITEIYARELAHRARHSGEKARAVQTGHRERARNHISHDLPL